MFCLWTVFCVYILSTAVRQGPALEPLSHQSESTNLLVCAHIRLYVCVCVCVCMCVL